MCVGAVCNEGYYESVLIKHALNATDGLPLDSAVCRPCHELCSFCTGPELSDCTACRSASTQDSQGLRSCIKENGKVGYHCGEWYNKIL